LSQQQCWLFFFVLYTGNMKLSKRSIAGYVLMLILGLPCLLLGLLTINNFGMTLVLLLLGAGLPLTGVAGYGLYKRQNLAMLPLNVKALLAVGITSLLCFVGLMTFLIVALRNFS